MSTPLLHPVTARSPVEWARAEASALDQHATMMETSHGPNTKGAELLTGNQLMDEMEAYVTAAGGNPAVARSIRDGFEGHGLHGDRAKGKLIHAVRNDLKVEEVTMYRRTAPKQSPPAQQPKSPLAEAVEQARGSPAPPIDKQGWA